MSGDIDVVTIMGSRLDRRVSESPYAMSVVSGDDLRAGGPMLNLSESLARVPGLVAANRSNYAQDLQISSRGFGARSTFGVRGLRLYSDGIPASMPDGSGQVSHFDLAGASRVEVLRGPFSALYGNSSGGVIALVSEPATERTLALGVDAGRFGMHQARVALAAPIDGGFDVRASASAFEYGGFRPHSSAQRAAENVRAGWQGERDRITVMASAFDQPADDALGLTRAQFDADPRQTTSQALQFNTRKTVDQAQTGVSWRHRFDAGALRDGEFVAYSGTRAVTQWQAITVAAQANPRHPGGVIDFDRGYSGVDARLRWIFDGAQLIAGAAWESQQEDRRGFENFTGTGAAQQLGVTGRLRRDETDTVRTRDVYAQGEVDLSPSVTLTGGVRGGSVNFDSRDRYLSNGDDSGQRRFTYTNPVAGLLWRAAPGLNAYASVGRGFESPTLSELAYRADGSGGFNDQLQPQTSRQAEVGMKWWPAPGAALDVALFSAHSDNEIAVLTNVGGRSTFRNVGASRRQGIEAAGRWDLSPTWRLSVAATWLDATYRDAFLACSGVPCSVPATPVAAGSLIPGTSRRSGFAELAWRIDPATQLAVEGRAQGRVPVNDVNDDFAAGFGLIALRASRQWAVAGGASLETWARVDNVADRVHAASVIVNEGNARYFESGPPRAWALGARLTQRF
jgi:iron complex outermembrane receptor protein